MKFEITFKGEGLHEEMKEVMRFINDSSTNHNWVYVGPSINRELPRLKLEHSKNEIDYGILDIVATIIDDIMGVDFVLRSNSVVLTERFSTIADEVRKKGQDHSKSINGGAITGLRSVNIVDERWQLSSFGVDVFKAVASHLKASD